MNGDKVTRHVVGVVRGKHRVAACSDGYSLWVEIAGPKGGHAWQMTPSVAVQLAGLLTQAADEAQAANRREART